jgi:hypothetical protein
MKTEHKTNKLQTTCRTGSDEFASSEREMAAGFWPINRLACLAFTMLAFASCAAHAQSQFEEDFDDLEKPWQEIAIQLPAAPVAENLLPFETVSATATQLFAVDAKSLTVGADGVVRYTLVSTSQSGAKNISYEGIRCHSMENKLYAFGHPDGAWARSRRDKWEKIPRHSTNNHHATLALEYFCDGRAVEIVNRLKMQQPIHRGN